MSCTRYPVDVDELECAIFISNFFSSYRTPETHFFKLFSSTVISTPIIHDIDSMGRIPVVVFYFIFNSIFLFFFNFSLNVRFFYVFITDHVEQ